jgi:hypothetical protein
VIGASGATVGSGTTTTDIGGRATTMIGLYYSAGGPGTYRVEATATQGGQTTSGIYTFQVTSTRSGR